MKVVTFNVNGLRQRISHFGSLANLLDSFDADIICFQETKLRRQEMTADVVRADGYESFFSCTQTSDKGRMGYSVAQPVIGLIVESGLTSGVTEVKLIGPLRHRPISCRNDVFQ